MELPEGMDIPEDADLSGGGDGNTAQEYVSVPVTTGVTDGDYIEITAGLQEGDVVAYIPTASSGSSGMMMGGMGGMGGMPGGMGGGMPGGGGGPGGF